MTTNVQLRRMPRQARGRERIARILDAAGQVFAEVGYEAATTNAIAARAQTPIGSLYHFFPHKEAILYALATQYLQDLQAAMETAAANAADLPLAAHVERTIDTVAAVMMA